MEVTPVNHIDAASARTSDQSGSDRSGVLRNAFSAVRTLNAENIPDRKFTIVRDPQSQKFVIRVIDRSTGDVVDQFPAENILKLLSEFGSSHASNEGSNK